MHVVVHVHVYFCMLPVTSAQPGIGRNVYCAFGDCFNISRHTVLCLGSCGFSHVHVHIHLAGSLTRKYPNTKEASANSTKKN